LTIEAAITIKLCMFRNAYGMRMESLFHEHR
jgi:hypothetical protein